MTTTGVIIDAWRALRAHADTCPQCHDTVVELSAVPEEPMRLYASLCRAGRDAFVLWDEAKRALPADSGPADRVLAQVREARRLFGFEGLDDAVANLRNRALDSMPTGAVARLRELDEGARMAELGAVEASIQHGDRMKHHQEEIDAGNERPCEGCDIRFLPQFERQRYHSSACRQKAYRDRKVQSRPRPSLLETE